MKAFDLVKGGSVVIYGAGVYGQEVYNQVKDIYKVECFIDRRKTAIEGIQIEVNDLEHSIKYRSCVVIVCVHNANWHANIAEDLNALGFEKIIFLAVSERYEKQCAITMNKIYNYLLEEQYDSLSDIPKYQTMIKSELGFNIIRENELWVIAWCGKDMLYTITSDEREELKLNKGKENMIDEIRFSLNVPIIANTPYISLFRFFMYGQGNANNYIRLFKSLSNCTEMGDDGFLQERYDTYRMLEREYEKGIDTFQYAPIPVKWNMNGGYFNIIDGHHRCAFYLLKGMQNVPVKMKREDYEKWMNVNCFKEVDFLLTKGHKLSMKVSHPVLGSYESKYVQYETTVLDLLQGWIFSNKLDFQSVLEIDDCQGYYAIQFYKMGKAQKMTCIVGDKSEEMFVKKLCALQYVPENAIIITNSLYDCNEKNSLVLLLGMYDEIELKEKMAELKRITSDVLFWQSKRNIEAEKTLLLNMGFNNYKRLGNKCVDGKASEIGVFTK